jgi:hypothetical protein
MGDLIGRLSGGVEPSYAPNPYYADVHLWIKSESEGTKDIQSVPPEVIQEFSYTHTIENAANQFSMTLIDTDWDVLEKRLLDARDMIFFQFGYTNGSPPLRSPIFCLGVQSIQPSFSIDHVQLKIEGLSAGVLNNGREAGAYEGAYTWGPGTKCHWGRGSPNTPEEIQVPVDTGQYREYPKGMTIAQIAQEIAWRSGLKPVIDATFDLLHTDLLEGTNQAQRTFVQTRSTDLAFLKHYLLPNCVRAKDRRGGFTLYIKDALGDDVSMDAVADSPTREPGWELHLHPRRYEDPAEFEFVYMRDQMSSVIDFTPELDIVTMLSLGAGEVGAPTTDQTTGMRTVPAASLLSDQDTVLMGRYAKLFGSGGWTRVGESNVWKPVSSRIGKSVIVPSRNFSQGRAQAKQRFIEMFDQSIVASMTVQGDPRLEPNKVARVLILKPDGDLHYTSGLYLMTEITHTISGGNYHCAIKLIKNAIDEIVGGDQLDSDTSGIESASSVVTAEE